MRRTSFRAPRHVLALCLLAAVPAGARQDDKVVPVHQEPRHRLVFDSPGARILDIQIPPGDTTLFHTHSDPILYVNMSSSQTRGQTLGREWSGGGAAAAERTAPENRTAPVAPVAPENRTAPVAPIAPVAPAAPARPGRMNSVTTYSEQPLTHRVNNIGTGVFRLIGVINRTAGDDSAAPSADFAAPPEVDNRWFRGYRWLLTAGPDAEHRHANPVAIVVVKGRAAVDSAKPIPLDSPGAFAFVEAGVAHRVSRVGADEAEVVEIEVRRPRP